MRHVRVVDRVVLAAAVLLSISSLAFGQAQTGSLSGTVTDQSGAPVPGASVGVKEERTGVAASTVTSEAGIYVFPSLPPGIWTITTEKSGFKRSVQSGFEIFIAQRQVLDLKLEVGDVKQSVEVAANQSLLETETSEKGQSLTPKMYETLPLWFGGLQNPSAFLGYMSNVNSGGELSIAGSTGRSREQLIDGTSNVIPESGGTVFNPPSAEAFGEVRLIVGNYSAEYGRVGGGLKSSPPGREITGSTEPGLTACGATSGKQPAGASIRTAPTPRDSGPRIA
jgi:hypothetical protein